MRPKLTTKDIGEKFKGLDLLPLGIVRRRHFHRRDLVAILTDADGSYHGFVGRICPGLCCVLGVDESFEVRVFRHGGCSDKECKPDS